MNPTPKPRPSFPARLDTGPAQAPAGAIKAVANYHTQKALEAKKA